MDPEMNRGKDQDRDQEMDEDVKTQWERPTHPLSPQAMDKDLRMMLKKRCEEAKNRKEPFGDIDKISMSENEQIEPKQKDNHDTEKGEIKELSTSSLSKEAQAEILEREHMKTRRHWIAWKDMDMEQQAVTLRAFDEFDEDTNPENVAKEAMKEAIAQENSRPLKRLEKYALEDNPSRHRMTYDNWLASLKTLFFRLRIAADDEQHWVKPESLPLYYRFAMRRPLMDERSFRMGLTELGVLPDFDVADTRYGNTRLDRKLRDVIRGRGWDLQGSHVSSSMGYLKPVGAHLGDWKDEIKNVSEVEEHTIQVLQSLERPEIKEGGLNDRTLDWPQEKPDTKKDEPNDRRVDDIISELTFFIELFRSGHIGLPQTITMIKDQLEGIKMQDQELIEDVLTNTEKDPVQAAGLIWDDAMDQSSSSSENDGEHALRSSDDKAADQAVDVVHQGIAFMKSTNGLSRSPPDNRPDKQPERAMTQGTQGAARANNKVENDAPVKFCVLDVPPNIPSEFLSAFPANIHHDVLSSGITRASFMTNTTQGGAMQTIRSTNHRTHDQEVVPGLFEPTLMNKEPPSAQGDPTPLTSRTNQLSTAFAARTQCESTSAPGSVLPTRETPPREPILYKTFMWDGNVTRHGRKRSPEDGWTDDLGGLLLSSKTARRLAVDMGLKAGWVKKHIRTGSIQRKARKLNIEKNAFVFPIRKRRNSTTSTTAFSRLKRKKSKAGDTIGLQRSNSHSERKVSTMTNLEMPLESSTVEGHSDVFAVEGETSEDFVRSHCEPEARTQPEARIQLGSLCPQCRLFRCACHDDWLSQSDAEPFCPNCYQQPCSCERSSKPPMNVPKYVPTIESVPKTVEENMAASGVSEPSKEPSVWLPILSRALEKDDVLASLRRFEKDPRSEDTFEGMRTVLEYFHHGQRAGEVGHSKEDREVSDIIYRILDLSEDLRLYNQRLFARPVISSPNTRDEILANSVVPKPSGEPNVMLAFLGRAMNNDDVLALIEQYGQNPSSEATIEGVRNVIEHIYRGNHAGELDYSNGEKDFEAFAIIRKIISSSEDLKIHQERMETGARKASPQKGSQRSEIPKGIDQMPLLAFFSRIMERDDVLEYLRRLRKDSQEHMSDEIIAIVNSIRDQWRKGMDTGKIGAHGSIYDREAGMILKGLSINVDGIMEGWRNRLDRQAVESCTSAKTLEEDSPGLPPEKSSPMCAYFAHVYPQTGFVKKLKHLEKEAMSKEKMNQVQLLFRLRQQCLDVGRFPATPGSKDRKDAKALAIMARLKASCSPLNAWEGNIPARAEPQETNAFSEDFALMALEPEDDPKGLGLLNSSHDPVLTPRPQASNGRPYATKKKTRDESGFYQNTSTPPRTLQNENVSIQSSEMSLQSSGAYGGMDYQSGSSTGITPLIGQISFSGGDGAHRYPNQQDTPATSFGSGNASPRSILKESPRPHATIDNDGIEMPARSSAPSLEPKDFPVSYCPSIPACGEVSKEPPDSAFESMDFFGSLTPPTSKIKLMLRPPELPKQEVSNLPEAPAPPNPESIDSFGPPPSPRPGFRDLSERPRSPKVEVKELYDPVPPPNSGLRDLWDIPLHSDVEAQHSPGPPPSPRPAFRDLPGPPVSPTTASDDLSEPPPSPRPGDGEWDGSFTGVGEMFGQPPSRRPASMDLPKSPVSPTTASDEVSEPPPSPRPRNLEWDRVSELFGPTPSPRPGSREITDQPLSPKLGVRIFSKSPAESSRSSSIREKSSSQRSELPGPAHKKWAKMSPKAALEFALQEALRQRKSFSGFMSERSAVRTRMKQENDEANAIWSGNRFFQTSNGSSGATTSNAISRLFDRYRGMLLEHSSPRKCIENC